MRTFDSLVAGVFRNAVLWSGLVIAAMTAMLVSTSTQMIRSRLKLERMKNQLLDRELWQAREIQLAWLPQISKALAGFDVGAVNEPAGHISGDFYDCFELPDGRLGLTIGDVTGHGMSAAFLMATTQLLIRTSMRDVGDPGRCLTEVNRHLCVQVFNGQFTTALVLVLDAQQREVLVASAGHFPPLLRTGDRLGPLDVQSQLVLGVQEDEAYVTQRFHLPEEFTLLLYTDGVVEATGSGRDRFGPQRLANCLASCDGAAQELVRTVLAAVRQFTGSRETTDDLTVVAVQPAPVAVAV